MGKKRCRALKLNREQCGRTARRGSEYCWQHQHSRLRGAPWYKNTIVHFAATVALTVAFSLAGIVVTQMGPTRRDQKEIMDVSKDILRRIDRVICNDSEKLLGKYPLGYALFVVSLRGEKHIVTPYPDTWVRTGMTLDWSSVKVVKVTREVLSMTPPDIGNIRWRGVAFTIKRNAGSAVDLLRIRNVDKPDAERVIVTIEVLEDVGENGLICLMGFREAAEGKAFPVDQEVKLGVIKNEE
jgi:hypothetical protein